VELKYIAQQWKKRARVRNGTRVLPTAEQSAAAAAPVWTALAEEDEVWSKPLQHTEP